jgi:uncharacterized protein YxeA
MEERKLFQEKESTVGPLIGSLIIIIVLVTGALFFLSKKIDERKIEITQEEKDQQEVINEMDSLEKELNDLNIDSVDKDVEDIEKEFYSI